MGSWVQTRCKVLEVMFLIDLVGASTGQYIWIIEFTLLKIVYEDI